MRRVPVRTPFRTGIRLRDSIRNRSLPPFKGGGLRCTSAIQQVRISGAAGDGGCAGTVSTATVPVMFAAPAAPQALVVPAAPQPAATQPVPQQASADRPD